MDDLSGLDWSSTSQTSKPPPMNSSSAFSYPSLRPTPSPITSGRNTPLSSQASGNIGTKPPSTKPSQDAFSNLMNIGSHKTTANLTLRERQEQLEAEKRKKEEEKRKQAQANFGDGQFWDTLGQRSGTASRTASPAIPPPSTAPSIGAVNPSSDDDLFAAFNADTKVDNASHYPPPQPVSGKSTPASSLNDPSAWTKPSTSNGGGFGDNDDDPFGLNQANSSRPAPQALSRDEEDDDDLLGDLGKPVDQIRRKQQPPPQQRQRAPEPGKPIEGPDSDSDDGAVVSTTSQDPFDKAVAQLVDYGFTPENARRGLTESGARLNVQAAVNWLLDDAHRQSKEKSKGGRGTSTEASHRSDGRSERDRNASPAWRNEGVPNRRDNGSPASGEPDFAKTAAAVGTSFLKTANSLWKTGQKKMQKAVAEFQQPEADPSQPKWMRSAQQDRMAGEGEKRHTDATDEAMALEANSRPARIQHPSQSRTEHRTAPRDQSPALSTTLSARSSSAPKWQQQQQQSSLLDPRVRLSKLSAEEPQAYISPARRKKPITPAPVESRPQPSEEPDLLFNSQAPTNSAPPPRQSQASPALNKAASQPPLPRKPPTPRTTRRVPPIQPAALQTSTRHRLDGTAHFKRGDYAAAHSSYSSSLAALPREHPLAILLLSNRALTALKTGEPRQAVEDADAAILLIGPGKGEGEHVQLQGEGGEKRDMKDLFGKALARKAEALEQMEKWADAAAVWTLCVESGVGGPTALAGRQRCQKALAPKPAVKPPTPAARSRTATPSARPVARPAASTRPQKDSEAVERLRAANQAAAKADDEKFALVDQVDARIAAWRDGKRENLRALLGSLDQVLWENSGWKKVGLHELVMANKVKIVYMKAIGKTHPDKLPQDASTEIRMIAGTVFATLNESWDKFKAENGL